MKSRGFKLIFVFALCLGASIGTLDGQTPLLKNNQLPERTIVSGERQSYLLALKAGEFLQVEVIQKEANVALVLFTPDGKELLKRNISYDLNGPESLSYIASKTGNYKLEVVLDEKDKIGGSYSIKLKQLRRPTVVDRKRVEAENNLQDGLNTGKKKGLNLERKLIKLKSSLLLWRQLKEKYWEAVTLAGIGIIYLELKYFRKSFDSFNQSLAAFRSISDEEGEYTTLFLLGMAYLGKENKPVKNKEKIDEQIALNYLQEAWSLAVKKKEENKEFVFFIGFYIAIIYTSSDDYKNALKYLELILPVARLINEPQIEASILVLLGVSYSELDDNQKALDSYNQLINLATKIDDKKNKADFLYSAGLGIQELGNKQQALQLFEEAQEIFRQTEEKKEQLKVLEAVAYLYVEAGEKEKSLEGYKKVIELARQIGDKEAEKQAMDSLVQFYTNTENLNLAAENYKKIINLARETGNRDAERRAMDSLGQFYVNSGDLNLAIESYKEILKIARNQGDFLGTIGNSRYLDSLKKRAVNSSAQIELIVQTEKIDRFPAVAFSKDERLLAIGNGNIFNNYASITLWDINTGKTLRQLIGHSGKIESITFSNDSKLMASIGTDRVVKVWEVKSGKEICSLKRGSNQGGGDRPNALAFSSDKRLLAHGGHDGTIRIWDLGLKKEIQNIKGYSDEILTISFSPDGKRIASDAGEVIKVWNVETGAEVFALKGHSENISYLLFNNKANLLVSSGYDGIIKFWDMDNGQEVQTFKDNLCSIESIAFSSDEQTIISYCVKRFSRRTSSLEGEAGINFLDIKSNKKLQTLKGSYIDSSFNLSPSGRICIGWDKADNKLKLLKVEDGTVIQVLGENLDSGISSIEELTSFSADGKTLAITSADDIKTIKIFDIENKNKIRFLKGHMNRINAISFSPDKKLLVSVSRDKSIKIWDVKSGKLVRTFQLSSENVSSVVFSSDGKTIAATDNKNIKIWNLASGLNIRLIKNLLTENCSIALSPNGELLACIDEDPEEFSLSYTVKFWDLKSGKEWQLIKGKLRSSSSPNENRVLFSPDGNQLATTTKDGILRFWNVNDGKEIPSPDKLPSWVKFNGHISLTNADGKTIIAFFEEGKINLVNFDTGEQIASISMFSEEDWAVITPAGRFDASEGALKFLHYSYGLEIISLEQLKEMYYEPGLLQKLLGYNREPMRSVVPLKDIKLYPEILEQKFNETTGKLTVKLKNRGGGIGKIEVYLNNKIAVADARDEKLKQNPDMLPDEVVSLAVDLPQSGFIKGKENQIKVVASNYLEEIGKGNIQSRGSEIIYHDQSKEEYSLPTLYAIVGGVSDYDGEQIDLRFAAKDAEDFSNALQLGARKLLCSTENPNCLDKVRITTLSTSGKEGTILPTKENFKKAFADVAAKAKPEDILVVYLSGHGVSFGVGTDTYFYLTQEARTTSREDLAKVYLTTAISSEELIEWLTTKEWAQEQRGIKALKQVLVLDTCASGNAAEKIALSAKRDLSGDQIRAIEFLKDKTGTFVLMASTADAPSYEASQYGQGLLTYSLLQGMKGAALDKGEFIDVQTLFSYAQLQVPRLAENIGGVQRPIVSAPLGKTFVIGQMTDSEKNRVNLPAPKPLLLRPLLFNPETNDDDLKLISEMRKRLDGESSYELMRRSGRGEPLFVYIDDDSFPGAIRVTGKYTIEGNKVHVKAFFKRDGKTVAALPYIFTSKEKVVEEMLTVIRAELMKITAN